MRKQYCKAFSFAAHGVKTRISIPHTCGKDGLQEVEKMPPDTRLTDAVILLQKAAQKVADFVDDKK